MNEPIAVVGLGAILPEAPDVSTFWHNIRSARYSITEVPPERWDVNLYYDPDPRAPDKTYSKIGGWVRGFRFEPLKLGIPIPPKIQQDMDEAQQWAIVASYQALQDYGYPRRPLNPERVAVILGNAMAGEKHYRSTIRVYLPEYLEILASLPDFQKLPPDLQASLLEGMKHGVQTRFPSINEDTMPGELANIIAGRVANAFNFSGPNFVTDAACASALSALQTAIDGLRFRQFDAVLTGGVDRNMGPESFIKFSKIGALSPDGSRPYAEGANGFVMGEGAAIFLLKRLADAERDGDKIYAVIRGIGGSSDGKGKGITAPNPLGQQRAIERAWKDADVPPETVGLIEGHGTSTAVGDPVEVASLTAFFGPSGLKPGSVALGSVKSNIGHLKSAAGAAGLLKTVLALHHKELPPSVNFHKPNPRIDFAHSPFYVNTETRPWEIRPGQVRRAGVSAFGFGGTNFHVVLEEYRPGALSGERIFPVPQRIAEIQATVPASPAEAPAALEAELPLYHGLFFLSASTVHELRQRVDEAYRQVEAGVLPPSRPPAWEAVRLPERLVIDYEDRADLLKRLQQAREALENDNASLWQSLALQGIYRGRGQPGKVAFLFPGQGSQYVNMLRDLAQLEPIVGETFREADRVMTPLLGRPLTDYIFVEGDKATLEKAEAELRNTAITQPAILTANVALLRLLERYGFRPDMVIGHSLGEYAALVAAGVLSFSEALQVVSARGKEMSRVSLADTGCMAAVSAPIEQVEAILKTIPGYVVIANLNSPTQSVIGGETAAVEAAIQACLAAGYQATKIPVSHAFHTRIVAPASQPLRRVIERMNLQPPRIPIAANVTGGAYPTTREAILDLLAEQIAAPVQFIRGIRWLYEQGARVFVEVGPKRVLSALVTDILKDRSDILSLATNHPRKGDRLSFHEALCRLYAAGVTDEKAQPTTPQATKTDIALSLPMRPIGSDSNATTPVAEKASLASSAQTVAPRLLTSDGRLPLTGSVVISGAGVGLPGRGRHVFSDDNIQALLRGEMRIEPLPEETRYAMLKRRPIRLVKSEAGAIIQEITEFDQTIKLAGQRGLFDPEEEFGLPAERAETMDISTLLAIAAGIEALRDAGIPLVMAYKRTTAGTYLPDRWKLPEALADETGVIFASAFPGLDRMAEEAERFYETESRRRRIDELRRMLSLVPDSQSELKKAIESRVTELEAELENMDYHLDRRYVFRILPMGHSQFAEYIGARGPNTHVNAACASTTHALSIAEDWIRTGRARRVIIIAGDDIISGHLSSWIGTSLMASGAATVEGNLRQAVLPFDRRRNGMIIGMGAAALVVESEDAVRERGMRAIAELLASVTANSAFHGTRLEVEHVAQMMERLVQVAERRFGLSRSDIAAQTVFVSHETYTPARGGSASAEIHALRRVFGEQANQVIIANTKGYTGHAMGVGIEDVLAVKALEYGIVPPIAHLDDGFEPDPALGDLNLSRGGQYPVRYALRLGAGFGSQIALALFRRISGVGERVERQVYQRWLNDIAGYEQAELEIVKRTLRIRDQGAPIRQPAKSGWEYGQGPTAWATASETTTLQEASSPAGEVAPSAPAVVATATPTPVKRDEIQAHLLAVVSEKTGYPTEALDLNLDLEADLGIDTVKQAELFALVREHYNIPRREDLRLSDYNTLAKVIDFVVESLQAGQTTPTPTTPLSAASAQETSSPAGEVATSTSAVTAAATPTPVNRDEIQAHLLAIVSEKTGYPTEALDLNLDLEADLGIDTVKQAELFALVREHYNIPRREDLRLSDYNTLAKVIDFVVESLAAQHALDTTSPVQTIRSEGQFQETSRTSMSDPADTSRAESLPEEPGIAIVRRVPVPVLRPRLELCLPTGITLEGRRILVVEGEDRVGEILARKLRARDAEVLRLKIQLPPDEFLAQVAAWQTERPIQGVYFLSALDPESTPDEMTLETWQAGLESRLYRLANLMRLLAPETFLICGTRLGGLHGYGADGAPSILGGAVSGFTKALGRERPTALVKVVDFSPQAKATEMATALLEETLYDPGAVEVGWRDGLRYGITLLEQGLASEANFVLEEGSIFLITGGSAGILGAVLDDLVRATRGVFYLLGRSPLLPSDDPLLQRLAQDREGLKKDLVRQMTAQGEKATPRQVEARLQTLERMAATHQALKQIIRQGGRAHYLICDVTDPQAVRQAVETIRQAEGRVDIVLHVAGIERSRKLESKPAEEFRQVVSVKADGFFHLYQALREHALLPRAFVFFSSVAGRFGNAGQTDYSAANDLLCKAASWLHVAHPELKISVLDWSAWGGAGMATRGAIPELMKRAGIDLLPPRQAAPFVRQELTHGGGEVVIAGSLGILTQASIPHGGLDLVKANTTLHVGEASAIFSGKVTDFSPDAWLTIESEINPQDHPLLLDHAINNIPVLPGVLGLQGFMTAAERIASSLASTDTSLKIARLEDIRFLIALKFYRHQPRQVIWKARALHQDGRLVVDVALESERVLKNRPAERMVHFTGRAILQSSKTLSEPVHPAPSWNGAPAVGATDIYKLYFHGPHFQVLEAVQCSEEGILGKLNPKLPALREDSQQIYRLPLLVELCFQTAGVWEIAQSGALALPNSIETLTVYRPIVKESRIYALVKPLQKEDGSWEFDARVLDAEGRVYLDLKAYRTTPLPYSASEDLLRPLRALTC